jgi:signal peptidase II
VVIDGFFKLRYSENRGVAFGMFQEMTGGRIVLTLMAVGAFALVLYYLRKSEPRATRLHVALGLVGGGAIGNLIDRMIYGRVTDFIVWHVKDHEWPAFNIADAALCIGVGLMLLDMFIAWWAARKTQPGTPTAKA